MAPHRCDRSSVEMTIQGSTSFTLRSCTRCQRRWWFIDGTPATIQEVIDGLRSIQRPRRRRAA
jgi:hypothetical protein